jgi:hypothetical protein
MINSIKATSLYRLSQCRVFCGRGNIDKGIFNYQQLSDANMSFINAIRIAVAPSLEITSGVS